MDYHELEKMTVVRLREKASEYPDIKATSAMKKDELVAALAEKLGLEKPEPKPKKKGKSKRAPLGKEQIKAKIVELREQRVNARSANDKKKVVLLRRRIHALKRRLRKTA